MIYRDEDMKRAYCPQCEKEPGRPHWCTVTVEDSQWPAGVGMGFTISPERDVQIPKVEAAVQGVQERIVRILSESWEPQPPAPLTFRQRVRAWVEEWRLRLSYGWDALCGRYDEDY